MFQLNEILYSSGRTADVKSVSYCRLAPLVLPTNLAHNIKYNLSIYDNHKRIVQCLNTYMN